MHVPHRKRVRHFHEPGDVHELTFSCFQRRPLLTNDAWRTNLVDAIDRSCRRHAMGLLAYVIMPEHVHLLVTPLAASPNFPRLLSDIKRPTSVRIKQRLVKARTRLLDRLTVLQRPGVLTFRFWQEGPGYDRNLNRDESIQAAIDYLHGNPVRRGLCRRAVDWKWSSAGRLWQDAADLSQPPALFRYDVAQGLLIAPEASGRKHC